MANKKISSMTELATTPASGDKVPLVDVSDTTGAATGTTKWVSVDNLVSDIAVADLAASAVVLESEGISGNDNDTTLPTSAAVKDYVDTNVTAQDLDFQGDSGGALAIDLDSESLTLAGGTGIDTVGSANTVTASIDSTVATLTGSQTLTNKTLTSPVIDTGVSGSAVLDSDSMSGASATTLATSESIKAYVDAQTHLELGTTSSTALAGDTTTISSGQASAIVANTAKVTNATHTGEVTGDTALTVADDVIDEANLKGVGTATNDHVLTADSTATGGMKWAAASGGGAPEGTAVLSTGETGGTKFLREDGDGTCSWVVPSGSGDVSKVGTPATGQVGYWTGAGTLAGEDALFWDASNDRLGIGTSAPRRHLQIYNPTDSGGGVGASTYLQITNLSTGSVSDGAGFQFGISGDGTAHIVQREDLGMVFSTNNAPRLTIDEDGSVGIGTDDPLAKIDVLGGDPYLGMFRNTVGGIRLQTDSSLNHIVSRGAADSGYRNLEIRAAASSSGLVLTTAGLVGIGTTSPTSLIHATQSGANGDYLAYLYNSSTSTNRHGLNVQIGASDATSYGLRVNTGGDSNALAVMGDGKTGIGGTPTEKLHVLAGVAKIDGKYVGGSAHTDWYNITLQNSDSNNSFYIRNIGDTGESDLSLDDKVYIKNSGLVGIGTSSLRAGGILQVDGGTGSGYVDIASANDLNAGLRLYENDVFKWQLYNDGDASDVFKVDYATGTAITVDQSGNVGIGKTPSTVLDIDDDGTGLRLTRSSVDLRFSTNTTNGNVGTESAHDFHIRTSSTNQLTIAAGGTATFKGSILTANNKQIGWRNSGDSANNDWILNGSDELLYRSGGSTLFSITDAGRVTVKKSSNSEIDTLTSSTSITLDMNDANNFSLTLDHNTTLNDPDNLTAGQSGCIVITQGSTGGTMGYGAKWHFEGGSAPTLSGGTLVDNLVYYVASTSSIHAVLLKDIKTT